MKRPRLGPRTLEYENPHQRVFRMEADFGGFAKTYYPSVHGTRVGLVVPREEEVLLVRQYRLMGDGPSLEIPGGRVDEGETPEQAALREAREEACVTCAGVVPLVRFMPGMDNYDNPTHVFVAHGVSDAGTFVPDEREVVERLWLPLDGALALIAAGGIACGMTILALLAYAMASRSPSFQPLAPLVPRSTGPGEPA